MRVNGIQGTDGTGTQAAASVSGQGEDFSSYLQTTASLEQIFEEAAQKYNVPKNLIKAIAKAESDFRPDVTSKAGAQGIMQLMPATARELGVTDSFDPYQNIMGGTKYISQMLQEYNGDISLALAAYNAGSNNVAKYGGIPPFKETQNYVVKVTQFMNEGVAAPNASYAVNSGSQNGPARGSIQAATVEEAEEKPAKKTAKTTKAAPAKKTAAKKTTAASAKKTTKAAAAKKTAAKKPAAQKAEPPEEG